VFCKHTLEGFYSTIHGSVSTTYKFIAIGQGNGSAACKFITTARFSNVKGFIHLCCKGFLLKNAL
jgi:hypothetical protein